jgi:hypothetical protein
MNILRKHSSTSNIIRTTLRNSTTGQGLTGLTHLSSGLLISTITDNEATATAYTVAGSTIETISTLGTYAAPTATKCRFKEVDSTNHPGLYEFQFADARFSVASAKLLRVCISGATSLIAKEITVQLTTMNVDTASGDLALAKGTNLTGLNDIAATDVVSSGAINTSGGAVTTVTSLTNKTGFALSTAANEAVAAAIEVELMNEGTGGAFMQAIADKLAADFDIEDLTIVAIRDAILNRVLAGNHDTDGSVGKVLQHLNTDVDEILDAAEAASSEATAAKNASVAAGVSIDTLSARATEGRLAKLDIAGTLAHTGNADTFKADVSGLLTSSSDAATFATRALNMIVLSGSNYVWTTDSLANAPSGGGSSGGGDATEETLQKILLRLQSLG